MSFPAKALALVRDDDRINVLIHHYMGQQSGWYPGKLELDILPRIRQRLLDEGIDISALCLKKRILNLYPEPQKSMPYE